MKWGLCTGLAIWLLAFCTQGSFATTVCNVAGLGAELETFTSLSCDGSLDHREAVGCVNRLAEELDQQRQRSEDAIAQAECLCKALNQNAGASGGYSRLRGSCSVEGIGGG